MVLCARVYGKRNRLRWTGHVKRMDVERIPKKIMFGMVTKGRRIVGRPRKSWVKCLEEDCAMVNVMHCQWVTAAAEDKRADWGLKISSLTSERVRKRPYLFIYLSKRNLMQ
jgi:hypothetical protein